MKKKKKKKKRKKSWGKSGKGAKGRREINGRKLAKKGNEGKKGGGVG